MSDCSPSPSWSKGKSSLPRVIHLSTEQMIADHHEISNRDAHLSESPWKTPPSKDKGTKLAGILKPSSYQKQSTRRDLSTPNTVNTSFSTSSMSTLESPMNLSVKCRDKRRSRSVLAGYSKEEKRAIHSQTDSIDRIIDCIHHHTTQNSPQRKHWMNENKPWKRSKIQHIQDLNERIHAAKARKVIEKKAYKREDKLLLRLAKELKRTTNVLRENKDELKELDEANKDLQLQWESCQQELRDLKTARVSLETKLRQERQTMLEIDRSSYQRRIQEQAIGLERLKSNHQIKCQELCESVLHAHTDLNRLRRMHLGNEHGTGQRKVHRNQRHPIWTLNFFAFIAIVGAGFILAFDRELMANRLVSFAIHSVDTRTSHQFSLHEMPYDEVTKKEWMHFAVSTFSSNTSTLDTSPIPTDGSLQHQEKNISLSNDTAVPPPRNARQNNHYHGQKSSSNKAKNMISSFVQKVAFHINHS